MSTQELSHEVQGKGAVTIVHFENRDTEEPFAPYLENYVKEAQHLLPSLSRSINISFEDRDNFGEDGIDGFAKSKDTIGIGVDGSNKDRDCQKEKLRPLVLHEAFHITQGFTYEAGQFSALDAAIYEGCATIFEREYANSTPKHGDYSRESPAKLQEWLAAIRGITADQYFEESGETWRKWAFYDAETDESWKIYKTGTWLVDTILQQGSLDIIDLQGMSAAAVLALYEPSK